MEYTASHHEYEQYPEGMYYDSGSNQTLSRDDRDSDLRYSSRDSKYTTIIRVRVPVAQTFQLAGSHGFFETTLGFAKSK